MIGDKMIIKDGVRDRICAALKRGFDNHCCRSDAEIASDPYKGMFDSMSIEIMKLFEELLNPLIAYKEIPSEEVPVLYEFVDHRLTYKAIPDEDVPVLEEKIEDQIRGMSHDFLVIDDQTPITYSGIWWQGGFFKPRSMEEMTPDELELLDHLKSDPEPKQETWRDREPLL